MLTPEEWAQSCRGNPRCGSCPLCYRDRRIVVDAATQPWRDGREPPLFPREQWPNLDAALEAWFWWHAWGPGPKSALGPQMERLRDGLGSEKPNSPDDRMHVAAALVGYVEEALRLAYGSVNPWAISPDRLRWALVVRTVGAPRRVKEYGRWVTKVERAPWDEVARVLGVSERTARSVVRVGRRACLVRLAARGLLPLPGRNSGLQAAVLSLRSTLMERT